MAPGKDGPRSTADPMIKITSLPMEQSPDAVLAKVAEDVAREAGFDINFITYFWQRFDAIHCPGCQTSGVKEPMFIDLYVPAFMTKDEIHRVMNALARALEDHTDYSRNDLFMYTHVGEKWQLFIKGEVVTNWKQVGGPDDGG